MNARKHRSKSAWVGSLRGAALAAALAAAPAAMQSAGAVDALPAAAAPAVTEATHWQKVPLDFSYSGFTTMYSCGGIEDKVKTLLAALGARGDARVMATGCEAGPDRYVSRFAFLRGEFHVLVPGAGATADETVQAQWQPVEIRANRPFSVGEGDCELIEQMKPVIEKAFALRESTYSTRCVPNSVSSNSFALKAQVLKAPKR
jgi:hypothetical protein